MKRVDENYSYDELEGFAPLRLERNASKDAVWCPLWKNKLSFSSAARKILFTKGSIRFFYNAERKQLLVAAGGAGEPNSIILPKSAAASVDCASIRDLIERAIRIDPRIVRVRIRGTVCRSKSSAIIFDLAGATTCKAGKKAKGEK